MTKKMGAVLVFVIMFSLSVLAKEPAKAAAQLTAATPHFHGGDEVSFTMTLNEPEGAGSMCGSRRRESTMSSRSPPVRRPTKIARSSC